MPITRGTTPWIAFALPVDITEDNIAEAYITIAQDGNVIADRALSEGQLRIDDEKDIVAAKLTQDDTLLLSADKITSAQLRFVDTDGEAYATEIITYNTYAILHEGVI